MTEDLRVQITFGLSDPDLEDDERLRFSKQVLPELRDLDEVERADRTEVMSPESGMKGFETLAGLFDGGCDGADVERFCRLDGRSPPRPV